MRATDDLTPEQLEAEILYELAEDERLRRELCRCVAHIGREARLLRAALLEDYARLRVTRDDVAARGLVREAGLVYWCCVRMLNHLSPEKKKPGSYSSGNGRVK